MNQQLLSDRLWDLAARVGKVIDALPDTKLGRQVSAQLVRCATSPAPNYDESGAAESRADFLHKISVSLKELRETRGWLRFIIKSELLPESKMAGLIDEAEQLCRILGKTVLTLKGHASSGPNDRFKMTDDRFQDSPSAPSRIIDLTQTMRPAMRGVNWEQATTVEREGWNSRMLHLYSHAGTHMDAQTHFGAGEETIDQHTPERCMGPAWVVRLGGVKPKQLHEVADLGDIAHLFRKGESLLLHSGWSLHAADPSLYRDQLPRISEGLARWCVERGVKMLGVEPPSVADVTNMEELTLIHRILLGGGVTIVEGLTNLDALTQAKVFFGALPLRIQGGDGCPCRAFAIEGEAGADFINLPL
jgi:four helix bundle protein